MQTEFSETRPAHLKSSLMTMLAAHIARHPYFYSSLAVHLLIALTVLYFTAEYLPGAERYVSTPAQYARVEASLEKAHQLEIKKRVDELKTIKQLLQESIDQKISNHRAENAESEALQDAPSGHEAPHELLADAQRLTQDIQRLEQKASAEELAKLLKIPAADALKKIEQDKPITPMSDIQKIDDKDVASEIEKLQEKSKQALIERQQQLAHEQNGTKISADLNNIEHRGTNNTDGGKQNGTGTANAGSGSGQAAGSGVKGEAEDINQRITNYINSDIPLPEKVGARGDIFSLGQGKIPVPNDSHLIKKTGRILGEGGEFTNRLYLNTWYIIGPFGGNSGRSIFSNPKYPPEQAIDLDAVYSGKNSRLLEWKYFTTNYYPLIPPDNEENAVYYGYTEIKMNEAQDLWAWIGADDTATIWLNDHVVYVGDDTSKGWYFEAVYHARTGDEQKNNWNLTETKKLFHFNKGRNKILFKLSNGPMQTFFSLVLSK